MTRGPIAVGTVCAGNYLSLARVLAESFRRHHPDVRFVVAIADEAEELLHPGREPFATLNLRDLSIPRLDRLTFRYSRFQLSVAAKPYLLQRLLDDGHEAALFLDVDTFVLGELSNLLDRTRRSAITVLPHLLDPLDAADRVHRELNILQSGVLNGGVVGVSECATARRFLAWWQDRVYWNCRYSLVEGLHYDQRWLDLIPAFFPEAQLFRDPCFNVAHWNLPERLAKRRDWRLFHFSGYEPAHPGRVTRYTDRVAMSGALRPLYVAYQRELEAAGWEETSSWAYAYDTWDNGTPIPEIVRALYADLGDEADRFGDPFRTNGSESFFDWLSQLVNGEGHITHLWAGIVRHRPDVQRAFPDPVGADREAFLSWTRESGAAEHDIPDALLR